MSVSELNRQARHLLESSFMQVWVEGELSGFSRPSSGHWYFSLKDRKCQVRCAMFRGMNRHVRTPPKEGDKVRIRGKVTLYENRGDFQIIVEHVEPAGLGALQQAFEELKRRLHAEGLFAPERKKAVPALPTHIGVVTSPTGAAIHDILTVLSRRCPAIPVTLYPTTVQGQPATAEIVRAIELAQTHGAADVLIIGRGGGSLEDLWCFNEESVARAIAACSIPTVSAVGHETDVTIADFVADFRAPTPSAAAEKVSPDQQDLLRQLKDRELRLTNAARRALQRLHTYLEHITARLRDPRRELLEKAQRLDDLEQRLGKSVFEHIERSRVRSTHLLQRLSLQSPGKQLASHRELLERSTLQLEKAMQSLLAARQEKLEHTAGTLNVVSPLATLGRGYAIIRDEQGNILRNAPDVAVGDRITASVASGSLSAEVKTVSPDNTWL
nr:exodeoxyribonuclease VII large subunit [Marinobacter adhaerens]